MDGHNTHRKTVDPIAHLRGHRGSISSVCFIRESLTTGVDSDSGSLDQKLESLSGNEEHFASPQILASCDTSGNAYLWNTSTRRIIAQFGFDRRERQVNITGQPCHSCDPGLCLRRLMSTSHHDDESQVSASRHFMYHTRGMEGIVSVLDIEQLPGSSSSDRGNISPVLTSNVDAKQTAISSIFEVQTRSSTFCAAAPCRGDTNLLAAPSDDECVARVYDIRMRADMPVLVVHGAGCPGSAARNYRPIDSEHREHGMLTSLSMSIAQSGTPILGCGMESGEIYFHDCRALRAIDQSSCSGSLFGGPLLGAEVNHFPTVGSMQLSRDPILSLDLFGYSSTKFNLREELSDSVIVIGGCAGDAAEGLPTTDRATGAIVKASFYHNLALPWIRIRSRFKTCDVDENAAGGKPGISCCRFRDDGKLFAAGGWDHRARIFSKKGTALAILKGHAETVTAVDWSADLYSGLFSTGSSDGKILLWRLFPSGR